MQYSSFIGDHIPCRYKSLIEDSSLKQLIFAGDDRPRVKPEFMAEFRNRVVSKGNSKTIVEGDLKGSSSKRKAGEEECRRLSLKEIFRLITRGGKFTRVFRGWKICSLIHDKPILYGLPDDPNARLHRANSLYLSSYDDYPQFISKSAKLTNLHSQSSALSVKLSASNLQRFGQRSAMKVRSCHVAGAENPSTPSRTQFLIGQPVRPASSGPVQQQRNDGVRSASSSDHQAGADEVIDVKFMHADEVESYASNYREGYTYRKLHKQRPRSTSIPAATTITMASRCPSPPAHHQMAKASLGRIEVFPTSHTHRSTGTPTSTRSTPSTNRSTPTTTRSTPTNSNISKPREKCNHGSRPDYIMKDQEVEQKIPTRWPANQRFHDLCDPQLTVNNPSPTEVAVLCQMTPGIGFQTLSSPSIPSNTNGKFGGKSKDRPYPFQLHISAASCLVQSTAKRAAKFNV